MRVLLIWCPGWPVVAAELVEGVPAREPVAVLRANRVLDASPAARGEGVTPGLRRREAQSRCPRLVVVDHDPGRDARAFEPVVVAVEQAAVGVEVLRPGVCAVPARGPSRYLGGSEAAAAEQIMEQIGQECGVEAQAGVADGIFAAELAARAGMVVPAGQSPAFLAGHPVEALERPELASRLRRLGIRTLGQFAALPAGDVLARFGFDAAWAHQLATGDDQRLLAPRRPPVDLSVTADYDEPVDRVDAAAFAARALAEQLHDRLAGHGLACTRLGIEALTGDGQERHRSWRHDGLLTAAAITDRVRWQLEGWLVSRDRPTAGIRRLRLVPDGVVTVAGLQPGLWGEHGEARARAHRALARVQGRLGPESVLSVVLGGGRSPDQQARLVPWGEQAAGAEPAASPAPAPRSSRASRGPAGAEPPAPWPGRLPAPAPATVLPAPVPVTVHDAQGRPVTVGGRLELSGHPAQLSIGDGPPLAVEEWAGPWPLDERWWAPAEARRVARFQVCLADGRALLLALTGGKWSIVGEYD